ncbi:glycosyltransferase family 4 protein [Butyrivibrio sp. WCD2001]|uniref:glycosyltransferase family 4 protein n=1 Tax=Butyrivibrio sp. WCD2001 TaxID=1280681 RepID=UPI00047BEB19|nr:glycosyltransferase family 4 protein [Butyrivibrio sp. WCD2001]
MRNKNQPQNKKLKICMIVQDPSVKGGIAAVTGGYYGSRLEQDFDITYVESYRDGSKLDKLTKALKAYREFRKVLKKDRPDIVHVHSSFGPSFFRKYPIIKMAHDAGIPVVNHIHGSALDELYTNAPAWKKRMVEKSYGSCDKLIVLSEDWKKKISAIVPAEMIEVVPNYSVIVPEMVSEGVMDKRFEKKQILYLGRFDNLKGVVDIPAIADKVIKKFPEAKFILGGTGETEPTEAEIKRLHLEDTVLLPGWIRGDEKIKLLEESSIFLLPSHMEAMPMSILEAMGYALPIISCEVGGIPRVVSKDVNGKLYKPQDVDGMADGILSYFSDRSAWEKASRQSLRLADEGYSFDSHINKLEEIYYTVARK